MKKLMLASAMMLGFVGFSFAQTSAKTAKPAPVKVEAKKPVVKSDAKTAAPATAAKPLTKAVATPAAKNTDMSGAVLKKDGTPDKRYTKEKAKGPVKKDGTPDKRFKENKKP